MINKTEIQAPYKGRAQERGFTLIEVALGLVIIGLIIAGSLNGFKVYSARKAIVENQEIQTKIVRALYNFMKQNGRLPCPADISLTSGMAGFGMETYNAGTGVCGAAGLVERTPPPIGATPVVPATDNVLIGAVPVSTLNIPFYLAIDGYNSKLRYAVVRSAAEGTNLNNPQISIRNQPAGPNVSASNFVIVSHGHDRKGAVRSNGTPSGIPCGVTALDSANCDLADTIFVERPHSSMGLFGTAQHFDDTLSHIITNTENSLWIVTPDANTGIKVTNRNTGAVVIGDPTGMQTPEPDTRLRIVGQTGMDALATPLTPPAGSVETFTIDTVNVDGGNMNVNAVGATGGNLIVRSSNNAVPVNPRFMTQTQMDNPAQLEGERVFVRANTMIQVQNTGRTGTVSAMGFQYNQGVDVPLPP
jgi:prepilin-type N-terminal cleavage/methylation domain-containing protein